MNETNELEPILETYKKHCGFAVYAEFEYGDRFYVAKYEYDSESKEERIITCSLTPIVVDEGTEIDNMPTLIGEELMLAMRKLFPYAKKVGIIKLTKYIKTVEQLYIDINPVREI
jgi:hypothetical protein